ncbi:response regulator transcription factor [Fusobacterium sp.]|uniref:response regulator transcription factor n=1 Tax=Fusobacterium sp. TaxID=68766 RepID=UPI00261CE55E|nr:response regulator transcription factor [Fusobacterium sp.]
MKKILLIEDDPKIRRVLQLELEHEGYFIDPCEDGGKAIEKAQKFDYDIILLDLMLPVLSGEEVCKKIRSFSDIPIIVITAKDDTFNKVELLDMGADDYITKPFAIEELFARIRVSLRNKNNFKSNKILSYDDLKMDLTTKRFYKNEIEINLTKTEYNLLEFFIINKEICISREKIIEELWGFDYSGDGKIIDVYINSLRKKIDEKTKKYFHSIRGFGYMFKLTLEEK